MNIKLTDPKLFLTFEGNDLEPGHSTSQTIESDYIINYSFSVRQQYLSSLKSASDQIGLQIKRKCASIEDIIATDGNVKAVLKDGEETIFTGYIATSYKWTVTDHGERTLAITIEGVGTRLLNQPFIETGKHFFDCSASAAVYTIVHPLGITIHEGDERKILQNVGKEVEAGDTCRDLLDALFYECNAVYWFNNLGELCVDVINPSTIGVQTVDSADLYVVGNEAVSLSKSLRAYKGARITYKALGSAGGYLVYRNTTGATATRVCDLELKAGEYFDGAGIYTAAGWSDITADAFREPTLIGAVNAASESQIVGSGKIVNISNLSPDVVADSGIVVTFEAAGGPYIKMLAHNTTGSTKTITRMDLYADIVYEMSDGVIRTQIDGSTAGKTLLEENLTWVHDKENASKHANLVSQYFQYASATYTFRTKKDIAPGTVIRLHEDLFSGLDVYVLITAKDLSAGAEIWKYTAVGISNFDLSESAYHGTTEPAKQSGAQGPAGEPGATAEVQYAIGDSLINPPGDAMQWASADMLWGGQTMFWNTGTWEEEVPTPERGKYIWMRTRIGDSPWQYTRLTGSTSWDPENLGLCTTACPTQSKEGLGLIPGDYFVAGDTFNDPSPSGPEYKKGWAYVYNGSGWDVLDLEDADNSSKALQCLGTIVSSETLVEDSTASIWGWFQNLVAQKAVIESLVAEIATIKELIVTGNIDNDAITTSNNTEAQSLAALVTTQENIYDVNGDSFGSSPQLMASVLNTLVPEGVTYVASGSVTIGSTTYTASDSNPLVFRKASGYFFISQNNVTIVRFTDGYFFSVYKGQDGERCYPESGSWLAYTIGTGNTRQVLDTSCVISSNSLAYIASYGKMYTHSLEPKAHLVDAVGTTSNPYHDGSFYNFEVQKLLKYSMDLYKDVNLYTSDTSQHGLELDTDESGLAVISIYYTGYSTNPVTSGLLPIYVNGSIGSDTTLLVPTGNNAFARVRIILSINSRHKIHISYQASSIPTSSQRYEINIRFYR